MDLIGHDTNFAVTQSVFDANFCDKRYRAVARPARDGRRRAARAQVRARLLRLRSRRRRAGAGGGRAVRRAAGAGRRDRRPARPRRRRRPLGGAARGRRRPLRARSGEPLERPADRHRRAAPDRRPRRDAARRRVRACATSPSSTSRSRPAAARRGRRWRWRSRPARRASWRGAGGRVARGSPAGSRRPIGDAPGLVVARTVAMLVNEGADAVQQGVCTAEGADLAMKLGVNYPAGPVRVAGALGRGRGGGAARPPRRPLPRRALSGQPRAARARLPGATGPRGGLSPAPRHRASAPALEPAGQLPRAGRSDHPARGGADDLDAAGDRPVQADDRHDLGGTSPSVCRSASCCSARSSPRSPRAGRGSHGRRGRSDPAVLLGGDAAAASRW